MSFHRNKNYVCGLWYVFTKKYPSRNQRETGSYDATWHVVGEVLESPNPHRIPILSPWLLILAWPSSSCCRNLRSEPVDGRSSSLFLTNILKMLSSLHNGVINYNNRPLDNEKLNRWKGPSRFSCDLWHICSVSGGAKGIISEIHCWKLSVAARSWLLRI